MGVIEVNFQTTKKMNRLGSGFDLCTLTKKRIIHWVAANKEQRKTQLISLSINRCAALNHLVVTQYFYLPFFLSFFPNLTGLFLSVFHLLHFALFSAMRPWMFFPPKNVSCDFKKAAAFWRVFFFSNCLPPRPTKLRFTNEGVLCSPRLRILCTTGIGHKTFNAEPARSSTPYDVSREKCSTLTMQKSSFEFVYLILGVGFFGNLAYLNGGSRSNPQGAYSHHSIKRTVLLNTASFLPCKHWNHLKVSKSRKQIMASWILSKNKRNSLSWAPSVLRIVSFVRFLEESRTLYLFLRFTDL